MSKTFIQEQGKSLLNLSKGDEKSQSQEGDKKAP